ncbi:flagellar basal-body rod protein FlgG [Lachnospiraceae bacterium KM106-2]|nr:flagellar basal-body rod protein FlgG [Lachnospiraceae bacterium KM106-2]
MIRSLWTAASGMISQQTNVDTISNNIANINTTAYKKESAEFKSLLYQTIQKETTKSDGTEKPGSIQVGLGVRNSAINSEFTQGSLQATGNNFDFAIEGNGFFMVQLADGSTAYTRSGSLQCAVGNGGMTIADTDGNPILDSTGKAIVIPGQYKASTITIDDNGNLCVPDASNNPQPIGIKIGLAQFNNPTGLEKIGDSMYKASSASGEAMIEGTGVTTNLSKLKQGYLEASNVSAADEMVDLIVAQRAYEMNSKTIQAADSMLQTANNLRS